jgi:hypothetical protein
LLLQGAENLISKHKNKVDEDDRKTLFIHWTFHPGLASERPLGDL